MLPAALPHAFVLDLRCDLTRSVVRLRHGCGWTCAHIPGAMLSARRMELPPRGKQYALLIDSASDADVATAHRLVESFPRDIVAVVDGGPAATLWDLLPQQCIVRGEGGEVESESSREPPPRLWQPSPFLAELLPQLRMLLYDSALTCDFSSLRILDAGSGMGRNAVALAQGVDCNVVAVDNRAVMSKLCTEFASRAGVSSSITAVTEDVCAHLRRTAQAPARSRYDVMLCARFLDRKALALASAALSSTAALIVIEHFHRSAKHPASPEDKLAEGEALEIVSASSAEPGGGARWVVLIERRGEAEDGRPLLLVVLRRRGESPEAGRGESPEAETSPADTIQRRGESPEAETSPADTIADCRA